MILDVCDDCSDVTEFDCEVVDVRERTNTEDLEEFICVFSIVDFFTNNSGYLRRKSGPKNLNLSSMQ